MLNKEQIKVLSMIKPGFPLIVMPDGFSARSAMASRPAPETPFLIPLFRVFGLEARGLIELAFDPERHANDIYVLTDKGRGVVGEAVGCQ